MVYCPDCGRTGRSGESYCPDCGYPVAALEKELVEEKVKSLGWAEKILGKPAVQPLPPEEPLPVSFATGREETAAREQEQRFHCETCGASVDLLTHCPACGDKLPGIMETDSFIGTVLRSPLRMTFGPRNFARTLPYPPAGGTLQPLLYPGVASALLLVTLPLSRPARWLGATDPTPAVLPAIIGFIASIVLVPLLLYLSATIVNLFARALGGRAPLRRTIRIAGALVIWLAILGTVYNLIAFGLFLGRDGVTQILGAVADVRSFYRNMERLHSAALAAVLGISAWEFGWLFGGLHRLNWRRAAALTILGYGMLAPLWVYLLIILPLNASGLL